MEDAAAAMACDHLQLKISDVPVVLPHVTETQSCECRNQVSAVNGISGTVAANTTQAACSNDIRSYGNSHSPGIKKQLRLTSQAGSHAIGRQLCHAQDWNTGLTEQLAIVRCKWRFKPILRPRAALLLSAHPNSGVQPEIPLRCWTAVFVK